MSRNFYAHGNLLYIVSGMQGCRWRRRLCRLSAASSASLCRRRWGNVRTYLRHGDASATWATPSHGSCRTPLAGSVLQDTTWCTKAAPSAPATSAVVCVAQGSPAAGRVADYTKNDQQKKCALITDNMLKIVNDLINFKRPVRLFSIIFCIIGFLSHIFLSAFSFKSMKTRPTIL